VPREERLALGGDRVDQKHAAYSGSHEKTSCERSSG
jgi:hypothetical protein